MHHHQIRQFPSCQSEYYDCIDLRSMTLPKKDASWFVYITFPPREHCWSYWGPVGCLWFSDWSTLNQHAHLLWRNHDNLGCSCFKEAWKSYCCVQVVGYTATKDSIFAWVHVDHKMFANKSDESLSFTYICYIIYKGYITKLNLYLSSYL